MEFIVENCSSPGAQFSKNTNDVMIKISKWIETNNAPTLKFIEFRRRLENEAKINDNNARNIYPFLKNGGLVNYLPGEELDTGTFFTKRGQAYLVALKTREQIENSDYSKAQKTQALKEVDTLLSSIIYDSLKLLVENKELNYSAPLKWYLLFLSKFGRVNKQEFALMVYSLNEYDENWEEQIQSIIHKYRNNEIDIIPKIRVRNDKKIQISTGQTHRLEQSTFFTCYTYFSSLVDQAGLTTKKNDYHIVLENADEKIALLLEG